MDAGEHLGTIRDDETLTSSALAERLGRKPLWAIKFLRKNNVPHRDLGNGLLAISGHSFREWLEETQGYTGGEPLDIDPPRR